MGMICQFCGKDTKAAGHIMAQCMALHNNRLSINEGQLVSDEDTRNVSKQPRTKLNMTDWDSISKASQWNRIRGAVYRRDANKCRKCGKKVENSNKHCHHIFGFETLASTYLADYVTLCSSCHGQIGTGYKLRADIGATSGMRRVPMGRFLRNSANELQQLPLILTRDGVDFAIIGPIKEGEI